SPSPITVLGNRGWREERQKHPEHGAPGLAVELDHAAMVADHLRDKCKTKASSISLGRDERVEQMRLEIVGDAAAVIGHRDHQRQMAAPLPSGYRKTQAVAISGRQSDFTAAFRRCLGSVLDEVEEGLEQEIAVAMHRRQ